MIKLEEAKLTDALPSALKQSPEAIAMSYAIKQALKKAYEYRRHSFIYADIDAMPEEALDLLAAELRTQYYTSDMDIELKRNMVKNAVLWHMKAGTPKAVSELVQNVFGEGEVKEWFDYDGQPYHFKITSNAMLTPDMNEKFIKIIKNVKNARSILDSIDVVRRVDETARVGIGTSLIRKPSAIKECYIPLKKQVSEVANIGIGVGYVRMPPAIKEYSMEEVN